MTRRRDRAVCADCTFAAHREAVAALRQLEREFAELAAPDADGRPGPWAIVQAATDWLATVRLVLRALGETGEGE